MPKNAVKQMLIIGCAADKRFHVLQKGASKPINEFDIALTVFVVPDAKSSSGEDPIQGGLAVASTGRHLVRLSSLTRIPLRTISLRNVAHAASGHAELIAR
jgi:hypothetical protein